MYFSSKEQIVHEEFLTFLTYFCQKPVFDMMVITVKNRWFSPPMSKTCQPCLEAWKSLTCCLFDDRTTNADSLSNKHFWYVFHFLITTIFQYVYIYSFCNHTLQTMNLLPESLLSVSLMLMLHGQAFSSLLLAPS